MKTRNLIIISVIVIFNLNVKAQIEVKTDGKVEVGTKPAESGTYSNLTVYGNCGASNQANFQVKYAPNAYNLKYTELSGLKEINGTSVWVALYAKEGYSSYAGYFSGDVYCTGVYRSSDINLKENIRNIDNALDKVLKIKGVTYDKKSDKLDYTNVSESAKKMKEDMRKDNLGFIAQDLKKSSTGSGNTG